MSAISIVPWTHAQLLWSSESLLWMHIGFFHSFISTSIFFVLVTFVNVNLLLYLYQLVRSTKCCFQYFLILPDSGRKKPKLNHRTQRKMAKYDWKGQNGMLPARWSHSLPDTVATQMILQRWIGNSCFTLCQQRKVISGRNNLYSWGGTVSPFFISPYRGEMARFRETSAQLQ